MQSRAAPGFAVKLIASGRCVGGCCFFSVVCGTCENDAVVLARGVLTLLWQDSDSV